MPERFFWPSSASRWRHISWPSSPAGFHGAHSPMTDGQDVQIANGTCFGPAADVNSANAELGRIKVRFFQSTAGELRTSSAVSGALSSSSQSKVCTGRCWAGSVSGGQCNACLLLCIIQAGTGSKKFWENGGMGVEAGRTLKSGGGVYSSRHYHRVCLVHVLHRTAPYRPPAVPT
jgi:hypothetical protein